MDNMHYDWYQIDLFSHFGIETKVHNAVHHLVGCIIPFSVCLVLQHPVVMNLV